MTKQEIARELETLGVTSDGQPDQEDLPPDLNAMLTKAKAKAASNVVALPTTKKVRALEDRVLVEPTSDLSNVRPIREGTKRHAMVQALLKGCTLDQLATATGWKRDVAGAAIYTDLKAAGLGVRRENGLLILMLPNGSNVVPLRPAAANADKAANR
ncbi:MAG: hypothetical protein IPL47_14965 [Phyllobacteriaceae bacterium]|nr:hypothetical protein [Phyllobacteriaceae bacterium]